MERARRAYYRHVTFDRVDFDRNSVILGADVCRNFHLVHGQNLSIGQGTVLNGDCYLNAQGGIRIGKYCHIGKGLTALSSNHNFRSSTRIPYDQHDIMQPIAIGDAVWIGANVSLSPGTQIGDGAIIALGAVVRGTVPPCAIVAGNPATVVGWRNKDDFNRLAREGAYA
ncbi:acyltransferase [Azohydromonas aeria]|uniref:acyltransferase n=1 Tax=Azohydromonas aeria TaxID=2590212 RepID=UPI0012FC7E4D|nr:acyltransferase [Azohydromonas aeria]